jgi:rare lipoprotein A
MLIPSASNPASVLRRPYAQILGAIGTQPILARCRLKQRGRSIMNRMIVGVLVGLLILGRFDSGLQPDSAVGVASYYKSGKITANGEPFNPHGITAAHRNLPFGTIVRVTNLSNGKTVVVRINDRGPFIRGRVIDLSLGAAKEVDLVTAGITQVSYTLIN